MLVRLSGCLFLALLSVLGFLIAERLPPREARLRQSQPKKKGGGGMMANLASAAIVHIGRYAYFGCGTFVLAG